MILKQKSIMVKIKMYIKYYLGLYISILSFNFRRSRCLRVLKIFFANNKIFISLDIFPLVIKEMTKCHEKLKLKITYQNRIVLEHFFGLI